MLTELWWGIASYGKWGTSTDRSCAGGGFAACLPSRIRQLGWSFIGSMSGINSVNLYTQVRPGSVGRALCGDGHNQLPICVLFVMPKLLLRGRVPGVCVISKRRHRHVMVVRLDAVQRPVGEPYFVACYLYVVLRRISACVFLYALTCFHGNREACFVRSGFSLALFCCVPRSPET